VNINWYRFDLFGRTATTTTDVIEII